MISLLESDTEVVKHGPPESVRRSRGFKHLGSEGNLCDLGPVGSRCRKPALRSSSTRLLTLAGHFLVRFESWLAKLRITNVSLLERDTKIDFHGFIGFETILCCFADYLNQLDAPSQIGQAQYGPDLNKAVRDAYIKTRNFIMVRSSFVFRTNRFLVQLTGLPRYDRLRTRWLRGPIRGLDQRSWSDTF